MPRKVTIWLDCADGRLPVSKSAPLDKDYFDRCLTLTETENKIDVGRSSSNVQNFKPESDNALFTSRVVSRSHAILSADINTGDVMVKDLGSVHGTWVNGRRVTPHFQQHLEAGDSLIFGQNIPHASHGYHEARTFRVTYWWGDIDGEDDKKSTNDVSDQAAAPALPPRPSGTFKVPVTSSEDESEDEDYDEQSDVELLSVHKKVIEKHIPATKKEDSGIVVLSESETESDDEVQVVSVTPNKKIVELDMADLHNDDDDEEDLDLTQTGFATSSTFEPRLPAYTTPEDQPYVYDARAFPKLPTAEPKETQSRNAIFRGDDRIRAWNTRGQDNHEPLLPTPDAEDDAAASNKLERPALSTLDEAYSSQGSDDEDEEVQHNTQDHITSQSTVDTSTQTSGLPPSIYPTLFSPSTYSNFESYGLTNDYRPSADRPIRSRWDVGPTMAPTLAISSYTGDSYESNDLQSRAKEFQNGMHELKAMHEPVSYGNSFTTSNTSWHNSPEQNASVPSAPTLAKRTLVNQPLRVTIPADKSKMSIRNIIEPVSKSASPEPEVIASARAEIPVDQTAVPMTKQNEEIIPTVTSTSGKKRKVDDVDDDLSAEQLGQDPTYALATSTDLGVEELTPEALSSIRRKRPFTMKAMQATIKSAVRARPFAEKRAARRIEQKKASTSAWMATVKPFLLGTLVGSVGVFGALLSLPDMK